MALSDGAIITEGGVSGRYQNRRVAEEDMGYRGPFMWGIPTLAHIIWPTRLRRNSTALKIIAQLCFCGI